MTAISRIPTNRNFLSPLGFNFNIYKTPNVNYFVQNASIPSISINTAEVGTPFNRLKYPGDKVDYGAFNITFRVDEELRNYIEIYNWIRDISRQGGFEGYRSLSSATPGSIFSDATLTVLSSSKNVIAEVTYKNLFPTALSELSFDTRLQDVDYIDVIATFAYESFSVEYLI